MNKGNKVKGMIHWVDANNCINVKVNIYDRLFKNAKPLNLDSFNKKSLIIRKNAKIENNIDINDYEARYQFERVGYFCLDSKVSRPNALVFNRTVSLRDTWAKMEQEQKRHN